MTKLIESIDWHKPISITPLSRGLLTQQGMAELARTLVIPQVAGHATMCPNTVSLKIHDTGLLRSWLERTHWPARLQAANTSVFNTGTGEVLSTWISIDQYEEMALDSLGTPFYQAMSAALHVWQQLHADEVSLDGHLRTQRRQFAGGNELRQALDLAQAA